MITAKKPMKKSLYPVTPTFEQASEKTTPRIRKLMGRFFLLDGTGAIISTDGEVELEALKKVLDMKVTAGFGLLKNLGYTVMLKGTENGYYKILYQNDLGFVAMRMNEVSEGKDVTRVRVSFWDSYVRSSVKRDYEGIIGMGIGWEFSSGGTHAVRNVNIAGVSLALGEGIIFLGGKIDGEEE